MTINQFRNIWDRQHRRYEKEAYQIFSRAFRETALDIPFNFINENNYEQIVDVSITTTDITNAYYEVYNEIGIKHGNYTGKSINKQIKIFTESAFLNEFQRTLLTWLFSNAGTRIQTVRDTYVKYIIEVISRGLLEDQSIRDIVKNMQIALGKRGSIWYRWQLLRIARTETTAAANHGAAVATQISGVVTDKVWISSDDARTRRPPKSRFNHLAMDGVRVGQNEQFNVNGDLIDFPGDPKGNPSNIINCYLPDNFIESKILEGQKSFYSGKALKIITSRGESVSVTPNHKILTKQGFVSANKINVGDNLVCNRFVKNRVFRLVNNYIKKKFFRVQYVFNSLETLFVSQKAMVTALDFDADGKFMYGNINVVYPKIFLKDSIVTKIHEKITNSGFMQSFFKSISIRRFSSFKFLGGRHNSFYSRLMSFLYLAFPLFFRHFRPLNFFALGLASRINATRYKPIGNSFSADANFLRELVYTDSRIISFDKVIEVIEFDFSGHVYDFTSVNGVNIVNNIYTSNCRCASAVVARRDSDGNIIRI